MDVLGDFVLLGFADHFLDRQTQLLCRRIHFEHCGSDGIAHLELVEDRIAEFLVGADKVEFGDEAFDIAKDSDEHTEIGDVADHAGDGTTLRIIMAESLPWVSFQLLHAQADVPGCCIDTGHDHIDHVAFLAEFNHVADFLGPRNVVDVQETVNALFKVDESTAVGHLHDWLGQGLALRITLGNGVPRILLELLQSQADPLLLQIVTKNFRLDHVADRKQFLGIVDPLGPR